MHMADALVSPVVAGVAAVVSGTLIVIAAKKVKNEGTENSVPLMGVMGAFIFAAQMINFSIPGTGSSGHIVGGILLSVLLGPWAGLITLTSVLIIQCLVFADGGLMALGCNIFNMAVCSCLIAYPLVFKPLIKFPASVIRIFSVSILACVVGLLIGAVAVTMETEASGITALPFKEFLLFMLPIHLIIGMGEGLATGAVLYFIQQSKPELLLQIRSSKESSFSNRKLGKSILVLAIIALLIGGGLSLVASSDPDGLEWSIARVTGQEELPATTGDNLYGVMENVQQSTAFIPDYDNTFAGIIGGIIVVLVIWVIAGLLQYKKKVVSKQNE